MIMTVKALMLNLMAMITITIIRSSSSSSSSSLVVVVVVVKKEEPLVFRRLVGRLLKNPRRLGRPFDSAPVPFWEARVLGFRL